VNRFGLSGLFFVGTASVAVHKLLALAAPKESFGKPESVEQCLTIMAEVSDEQRERNRHLDTKAGSIAGFAGTALTLNLTLGRPLLQQHFHSHPWAHGVIRDAFITSAALFAAAGLTAVFKVLKPAPTDDLDEEAIDSYSNRPKMIMPPPELREKWLRTVTDMTLSDRKAGNAKAKWSEAVVVLLALGIVGLLTQAVTLGVAS
jgi:hypothetical protein